MCTRNMSWLGDLKIDTIIDVGANVGQWATLARQSWPDAYIYSFEPLPNDFMILEQKFKNDNKFNAFNCAVCDFTGKTEFNVSSFTQSSSMLEMGDLHKTAFPFSAENNKIRVDCISIDELVSRGSIVLDKKNILLKIDTQGTEDRVLRGALNSLKYIKVCFVETSFQSLYKDQPLFSDIILSMSAYKFSYFGNMFGMLNNPSNGTPLEEDSIFINNKLLDNGVYIGGDICHDKDTQNDNI